MSLKQLADETVTGLMNAIEDYEFSENQKQVLEELIENSIVQAVNQASKVHNETTIICCGPEADIAHKIAWEAEQKTQLLISNLSSLQ